MSSLFEDRYRARAILAFDLVKSIEESIDRNNENEEEKKRKIKRLHSLCKRLPSMIHERGLLSTLLFLQKKQTEVESALVKKIMDWLSDLVPEEEENLIEYLIGSCTLAQEQMLTKEALMFVKWVSRCIEARES